MIVRPVKAQAWAMTTQGVGKRWEFFGPIKVSGGVEKRVADMVPKLLRNKSLRLSIDIKTRKTRMARGHEEETSEQTVNPSALLRVVRTAIAQGLRARNEAPQELPPELVALLDRLKDQQQ